MRRLLPDPVDDVDLVAAYAYPRRRPWLRGNMIESADGAATVDGHAGGLGNPADQRILGLLRALSDVVIAGAGTVVTEGYGPARAREDYQAARATAGQPPAPVMAVVSNQLRLDFSSRYFTEALQREPRITSHSGVIVIVPADPVTERWLESSVGGYVDVALRRIVKRDDIGATVRYTGRPVVLDGLHVRCTYRDGQVVLSLAP